MLLFLAARLLPAAVPTVSAEKVMCFFFAPASRHEVDSTPRDGV